MGKPLQYTLIGAIVLVAVAGSWRLLRTDSPPAPAPTPQPVVIDYGFGASIPPVFAGKPQGQADARRIAGQLDALADAIERDSKQGSPQLAHVASVYDLWTAAVVSAFDGKRIIDTYPTFGPVIETVIGGNFPDSNARLDAANRSKIVAIFRAAAKACREAG